MDGARYLEDGKLTVFRRSGTYYARIRLPSHKYIWRSDIQNLACAGAVTLAALISPSSPAGVVTEQLGLNIDGYLLDRPICRRPREHSRP